jgi:hypothetical protein
MVLKVGEMIVEERKVRCTGCGIVLILKPDTSSPTGISTTLPEQQLGTKKKSDKDLAKQRNILLAIGGLILVGAAIGLWWMFRPPADRARIEGEVTLDDRPLEKGKIVFQHQTSMRLVEAEISNGRYRLSAYSGPELGNNKVRIHGFVPTGKMVDKIGGRPNEQVEEMGESVASKYNISSTEVFEVKPGANTANYKVASK